MWKQTAEAWKENRGQIHFYSSAEVAFLLIIAEENVFNKYES